MLSAGPLYRIRTRLGALPTEKQKRVGSYEKTAGGLRSLVELLQNATSTAETVMADVALLCGHVRELQDRLDLETGQVRLLRQQLAESTDTVTEQGAQMCAVGPVGDHNGGHNADGPAAGWGIVRALLPRDETGYVGHRARALFRVLWYCARCLKISIPSFRTRLLCLLAPSERTPAARPGRLVGAFGAAARLRARTHGRRSSKICNLLSRCSGDGMVLTVLSRQEVCSCASCAGGVSDACRHPATSVAQRVFLSAHCPRTGKSSRNYRTLRWMQRERSVARTW
jgi:hypothetical protein